MERADIQTTVEGYDRGFCRAFHKAMVNNLREHSPTKWFYQSELQILKIWQKILFYIANTGRRILMKLSASSILSKL